MLCSSASRVTGTAMEHWTEYTRFVTALAVILNPFAALPIFLSLTRDYQSRELAGVALISAATVGGVLVVSALGGEPLLAWLGTSLASFRVGGGMVLLLMAFAMLRAKPDEIKTSPGEAAAAENKASIAVVPLGMPLLAGPGSISTVIIETHRSTAIYHHMLVMLSIGVVCLFLWVVLRLAQPIGRLLGPIGLNIINRLFGLMLAAIAVEIMANGLRELFPALTIAGG